MATLGLLASSCGGSDEAGAKDVIGTYADGVHASYEKSLESATDMDKALDAFVAGPTLNTLTTARNSWLAARDDYGKTEAFRFYGGPIDNEETGKEGEINAWPLDEVYIDYVEGNPNAGIINNKAAYPTIDREVLTEANEKDGEANISTGWHAIEFLLWGQDLSETGAGNRQFTDYTTAANADRRKTYLSQTSDLLISDLTELVDAWSPDKDDNYRAEFVKLDEKEALRRMITGIGELSRGELAGERMSVAFLDRSQEDEHSCFSDNTTKDITANAEGIRMVVTGEYGNGVEGPGFADLVETKDKTLAETLVKQVTESVTLTKSIAAPFDQHLKANVSDESAGRKAISATMTSLETQTDTIVSAANALGVTISVS
jgi:putative iron-regulated protein